MSSTEDDASMSAPESYTKLTVLLHEAATRSLHFAVATTGHTRTDTVNRALVLYDMIVAAEKAYVQAGRACELRYDVHDGEPRMLIRLFPPPRKWPWPWSKVIKR